MVKAVWDFTSAFSKRASSNPPLRTYIMCLDVHHSTSSGGQDAPVCTGKRLEELGEKGEVPLTPWGLLITYILSIPRGCFFVVRDWRFMVPWIHCTRVI